MSIDPENPYATSGTRTDAQLPPIEGLAQFVRINQIIVAVLAAGLITFLLVASVRMLGNGQAFTNWSFSFLTILGLAGLGVGIPICFIIPQLLPLRKGHNATYQTDQLKQFFSMQLIMRCAVIEGPSFLNVIAFMQDHNLASVIAALIGVACIATQFPTMSSVKDWFARLR